MSAAVRRSDDSTHLANSGHLMKLSLYGLHSSAKWITLKFWPGCTQNGRNKMAADVGLRHSGKTKQEQQCGTNMSSLNASFSFHLKCIYFKTCFSVLHSQLCVGRQRNLTWSNPGPGKPPRWRGAAGTTKSNLINHRGLSCVSINIQSGAEKLFESGWGRIIHSREKFASAGELRPWILATVIILIRQPPSQTPNQNS